MQSFGQYTPYSGGQPTTNYQNQYNTLTRNYNQDVGSTMSGLASRGLFGSSVANNQMGNLNYGLGQAQASLANSQANQEFANSQAQKQMGLQAQGQNFAQQQQLYNMGMQQDALKNSNNPFLYSISMPNLPNMQQAINYGNSFGGGY